MEQFHGNMYIQSVSYRYKTLQQEEDMTMSPPFRSGHYHHSAVPYMMTVVMGLDVPWEGLDVTWVGLDVTRVGLNLTWVGLDITLLRHDTHH